jgi:hypothetical protein
MASCGNGYSASVVSLPRITCGGAVVSYSGACEWKVLAAVKSDISSIEVSISGATCSGAGKSTGERSLLLHTASCSSLRIESDISETNCSSVGLSMASKVGKGHADIFYRSAIRSSRDVIGCGVDVRCTGVCRECVTQN